MKVLSSFIHWGNQGEYLMKCMCKNIYLQSRLFKLPLLSKINKQPIIELMIISSLFAGLALMPKQAIAEKEWRPPIIKNGSAAEIKKSKLRWRVAEAQAKWHKNVKNRTFTTGYDGLVEGVRSDKDKIKLMPKAAKALNLLFEQAKADLKQDKENGNKCALGTRQIFLQSGHRNFNAEKRIWKKVFNKKYNQYINDNPTLKNKFGSKAKNGTLRKMKKSKALPGFSNHSKGLAIDFSTKVKKHKAKLGPSFSQKSKWKNDTWLHPWLLRHAWEFGFVPLDSEQWHWNYFPSEAKEQVSLTKAKIACNARGTKKQANKNKKVKKVKKVKSSEKTSRSKRSEVQDPFSKKKPDE